MFFYNPFELCVIAYFIFQVHYYFQLGQQAESGTSQTTNVPVASPTTIQVLQPGTGQIQTVAIAANQPQDQVRVFCTFYVENRRQSVTPCSGAYYRRLRRYRIPLVMLSPLLEQHLRYFNYKIQLRVHQLSRPMEYISFNKLSLQTERCNTYRYKNCHIFLNIQSD